MAHDSSLLTRFFIGHNRTTTRFSLEWDEESYVNSLFLKDPTSIRHRTKTLRPQISKPNVHHIINIYIDVATNVAKTFLSLIDKHFPKNKKLSKIFNRNTIKVSYSCLPNVKQTISNNNHRLLQLHRMKESTQDSKLCNCRQKTSCPLDGKCLTKCVVYKATVTETTSKKQETYIGLTENEFKTRFNLHKSSFKLEHKRTSTTLSDHVWKLKKKNINFNISWQVVKRVKPFAPSNKVCGLCLQEKLSILRSAPSLNKRSEIFGHCIHRKKFLLSNLSMSTDEVSIADRNSES